MVKDSKVQALKAKLDEVSLASQASEEEGERTPGRGADGGSINWQRQEWALRIRCEEDDLVVGDDIHQRSIPLNNRR